MQPKHSKSMIDSFRGPGLCEFCNRPCGERHAAHVHSKGSGGPYIRCNLISLGCAGCCNCHGMNHASEITRDDLLKVVAEREGCLPEDISSVVYFFRRLDKHATEEHFRQAAELLTDSARELALRTWAEIPEKVRS